MREWIFIENHKSCIHYPKERDETMIFEIAVIDDSINFLESTPPFGYELHGLLVPTMQLSLKGRRGEKTTTKSPPRKLPKRKTDLWKRVSLSRESRNTNLLVELKKRKSGAFQSGIREEQSQHPF